MNTVVKQERRNPVKIVLLMFCACLIALSGVAFSPQQAHAETWQQYLSRMWSDCETKFANLDKSTGLMPWDGSSVMPAIGTGTQADPYIVATPAELSGVMAKIGSDHSTEQYVVLANDIDLAGHQWSPTNLGATNNVISIDGGGHTIYNLTVSANGPTGHTGAGLAFVSYVDNPNFIMKNLSFRYGNVRALSPGGTSQYNFAVGVAYFKRGTLDNVHIVDSLVAGQRFAAGLAVGWDTGYKAVDAAANPVAGFNATTGTLINNCSTTRVYTYGSWCIGNFTAPLMGSKVTNSYAVDGVTVSTAGHSGGFVSCPGYNYIEDCYCNITMYGQSQTSVFSGVNHYNNNFTRCVASGVVEGETSVGGFLGDGSSGGTSAYTSKYTDCYSTTMTGMQNEASNMGGFVGNADGNITFTNCYAAGEVGALTTAGNAISVGGFVGNSNNARFQNCYYDEQTTARGENGKGTGTVVAATAGIPAITGKLTREMSGVNALSQMPGLSSDLWVAKDGVYPQLKVFANAENFPAASVSTIKAYSMASVCTAMLYPSNGDYEDTNYDTVRNITYLFPFTNDEMVKDSSFAVSWKADDNKSSVSGMENIPVITLNQSDYSVASLAPGIGWTTVYVKYYPNPSDKSVYATGTRRLRLVPTTTLSVATAAGVDHTAYVAVEGSRPLDSDKYSDFMRYDHRKGVNFSIGSAVDLAGGKLNTEAFPANNEEFSGVELSTVKGTVNVLVSKQAADGTWQELELTDDLKSLLLYKRNAETKDLGKYKLTYHWYAKGEGGAYLESVKYLDVIETFSVTYMQNTENLTLPENPVSPVKVDENAGVATQSEETAVAQADVSQGTYFYDPGAYVPGDTVAATYYPGAANRQENTPDNPATAGYDFKGWSTDAGDGTNNVVNFTEQTPIQGNTTVYGNWARAPRSVTFDANQGAFADGTDKAVDSSHHALDTMTVPTDNPTREGYSFMGWAKDPEAKAADFKDTDQLWDEDMTYYAVWTPKPVEKVTVTVDNITDPDHKTVQVGDVLKNTITPENIADSPDSVWKGVVVTAPIPDGVTLKPDTIVLKAPDGTETKLDPKDVYDPETKTLKVPVGDIKGGEKYEVIYETEVNSQAVDEDVDVVTKVETSGSDPDGTPRPVVPEEELPVGGDDVLPANPDPEVTITVTNKTRGDKVDAMVDDVLGYTVDLTNKAPYSVLEDGVITIEIPNGLTLLSDTLTLVTPAGSTIKLTPDVYDPDTRTIKIPVGEVPGEESAVLTFDAIINKNSVDPATPEDHNIGVKAVVDGVDPEDEIVGPLDSGYVFPTGWVKYVTPVPIVQKSVANLDRDDGNFYQGDLLEYTIEVGNDMPATVWKDIEVRDVMSDGHELSLRSIKLIHPDGTVERIPADAYNADERVISVVIPEVKGGETWKLTYEATLFKPADGGDVSNDVDAVGDGLVTGEEISGDAWVKILSPEPAPESDAERVVKRVLSQTGDDASAILALLVCALGSGLVVSGCIVARRSRKRD